MSWSGRERSERVITSSRPASSVRGEGRHHLGGPSLFRSWWLACALLWPATVSAHETSLTITQSAKETFVVEGRFSVPVATTLVWHVLTDYDAIGRFVSSMKKSRTVRREGSEAWVAQTAEAKVWIITYPMSVSLKVKETPQSAIEFQDESLKDFKRYEGSWHLEPGKAGVEVVYRLTAKPGLPVPGFMTEAVMRDNADGLLKEVRAEILRRDGLDKPGEAVSVPSSIEVAEKK